MPETEHTIITWKADNSGSSSLDRAELTDCINTLIGHTPKSLTIEDIEIAFADALLEYKS